MLIPLRQFGDAGIVQDVPAHELPPNAISGGKNVMFRDGAARKMGGNKIIAYDISSENSLWFETWQYQVGTYKQVIGLADGTLRVWNGSSISAPVIQNQGGSVTVLSATSAWQSTVFGRFAVMNNRVEMPLYSWNSGTSSPDGSVFRMIPAWGAANSPSGAVKSIRSHRNFLVAVGVANAPYNVYWSDAAATDSFPASWDYSDTTKLAGYVQVAASDGPLIDCREMGDTMIVYTQYAAYALQYVGGSDVFGIRRLFSYGLINRECAVSFQNQHFCVVDNRIYVHDGMNISRPAERKVERALFREISDWSKCLVASIEGKNEIWIYYTMAGGTSPNRALVWNWHNNTWTFIDLPGYTCIAPSVVISAPLTIGSLSGGIGDLAGTIGEFGRTGANQVLMATPGDGNATVTFGLYQLDTGVKFGQNYYDAYIERTGVDLDEWRKEATTSMRIRSVMPQITGSGSVNVQIGTQRSANDSVLWDTVKTLSLDGGQNYKVDVRKTGRYLAWRIGSWNGSPTGSVWEFSGMDIDVQEAGR